MDFVDFPDDILLRIFDLLPPVYINLIFLYVPELRQLVIDTYMTQVLFYVSRHQFFRCNLRNFGNRTARFHSYDTEKFFKLNIVPKQIEIVTGDDGMVKFVRLIHEHFELFSNKNVELQLIFEELPNFNAILLLSKLQANITKVALLPRFSCDKFRSVYFNPHDKLKVLAFGGKKKYWDYILSPRITSLYKLYDANNLLVPMVFSKFSMRDISNATNTYSTNLKILSLRNLEMFPYVYVNEFPKTLEYLDILGNYINYRSKFHCNGSWPPKLKTLILNKNSIDDDVLEEFSLFGWPRELEVLDISSNDFHYLKHLRNLPDTLKYLDINTLCGWSLLQILLKAEHDNLGGYPYFEFPPLLERLKMDTCILTEQTRINEVDIQFPKHLIELSMNRCKITINICKFPRSLKILLLAQNHISDVTNFYDWQRLTSLTDLVLSRNDIYSINEWLPPVNLRKLDLDCNNGIPLENTPIFQSSKNFKLKLESLNLGESYVCDFSKIELPPLLKKLSLRSNYGTTRNLKVPLQFTQILEELIFHQCNLEGEIRFDKTSTKSPLRKLNLQGCRLDGNFVRSFYNEIEVNLQLKALERQPYINSLHKFK